MKASVIIGLALAGVLAAAAAQANYACNITDNWTGNRFTGICDDRGQPISRGGGDLPYTPQSSPPPTYYVVAPPNFRPPPPPRPVPLCLIHGRWRPCR